MRTGFTLIELLVVIFIISLVSMVIVVKTNGNSSARELTTFSILLKSQMEVAREEAILQTSVLALGINPQHYQFYEYTGSIESDGWVPLKKIDPFWQNYKIPASITLDLPKISKNQTDNDFTILFYPSGEMTAFQLILHSRNGKTAVELIGQTNGSLRLKRSTGE